MKKLEEEPKYEKDTEEDVMFGNCEPIKSFWGAGAIKKNM
jgi:hypothetical protein